MRRDGDALFLTGPDGNDWPVPIVRGFGGFAEMIGAARFPTDPNAGILSVLGYPQGEEYLAVDGHVYQRFERAVLEFTPDAPAPWDITLAPEDKAIPQARVTG